MRKVFLTILSVLSTLITYGASIGTWTSYLAYGDITEIEPAEKMVYVLSSKGLFSYNTNDHHVETYDKMNVLNDCNIKHIAYCKSAKRLVIIYENQNIDLLDEKGNVVNISDYHNKSMTVDKTINEVKIIGKWAYLSTNFGILKVNVSNAEISATYNLGKSVMSTDVLNDHIYAACGNNGIIKANTTDNLLDKSFWKKESDLAVDHLFHFDGKLIGATNGYIYYKDADEWKKAYDFNFSFCNNINDQLILGNQYSVWIFSDMDHLTTVDQQDFTFKAFAYDSVNKCYWSNQADNKLYSLQIEDHRILPVTTDINPEGPKYNYFGFMTYTNQRLYSCGGGYDSFAELFREATVQTYQDQSWTIYQDDIQPIVNNRFEDMTCLAVDPQNKNHVFTGSRAGIYEYLDGKFVRHYHPENSLLMYSTPDNSPDYILTLGITFDKEGNLWCLNSLAEDRSILCLNKDNTWEDHHQKKLMDDNNRSLPNMKCLTLDSRGYLWFVNNHWSIPSFYCYRPKTEAFNSYTSFINEDGTNVSTTGVRCICEDKNGNMWIGTNVGPLMLPSTDIDNGDNAILQQIKVPRNDGTNFADYLLSGVDISCIAVDGGNRKWFGTNGYGVYLISDDNMTQVQHFLTSNSPLLSDFIESITINDQTGEVFFGTENGLCSYMSDASATQETMTSDNVYAYPNPVEPGYTGLITVTGLSMNADVKILTANGALVAQGTSNGGTFTWDGCDRSGHRVASGVYMVHTATSDGNKGAVCKIAIVN